MVYLILDIKKAHPCFQRQGERKVTQRFKVGNWVPVFAFIFEPLSESRKRSVYNEKAPLRIAEGLVIFFGGGGGSWTHVQTCYGKGSYMLIPVFDFALRAWPDTITQRYSPLVLAAKQGERLTERPVVGPLLYPTGKRSRRGAA